MATGPIDRGAFVERWSVRARDSGDPFDAFFSLWIALAVRARPQLNPGEQTGLDTDRRAVLRLSEAHRDAIFRDVDAERECLSELARRKGTRRGDPIVDVHDYCTNRDHLRDRFARLSAHYSGGQQSKPGMIVEAVVELLNHVRNNLFHGIKDPEDVDDQRLVERLCALLLAVLRATAP